jgi:maleate isomerase
MKTEDITQSDLPVDLDTRPVPRRIGLLLLATDHTTERDFARICRPDEVGVYANRIAYENPTTPENLFRMQPRLTAGAAMILPDETLDALYYGCTAASVVIGDEAVEAAVHAAKPDVPVITPSGAARVAFRVLGVRRISILTPYLPETSAPMATYFQGCGLDVVNLTCLGLDDDRVMARVNPATIVTAACETISPDSEALFISCTALRAAEVAGEIEQRIGKPVVTSNQAGIWLTLRRAGIERPIEGHGRITQLSAPPDDERAASA